MRTTWLYILLIFSSVSFASDVVDIEFMASGKTTYRTTKLSSDLETDYGGEFKNAKVLLIETPSLSSAEYKSQDLELGQLGHNAEEFQVLFVVACPTEEYKHGYHTSTEVAKTLLVGEPKFRVRHLNSNGVVINESFSPVVVEILIQWLSQNDS